MEKLTSIDLIILCTSLTRSLTMKMTPAFRAFLLATFKKTTQELRSRDVGEIAAALEDIKRAEPAIAHEANELINVLTLLQRLKKDIDFNF